MSQAAGFNITTRSDSSTAQIPASAAVDHAASKACSSWSLSRWVDTLFILSAHVKSLIIFYFNFFSEDMVISIGTFEPQRYFLYIYNNVFVHFSLFRRQIVPKSIEIGLLSIKRAF
jgi:hypothetical protein